ncbi:MAG: amidohydrolase, partial [Pseudolabrys sp.]
FTLETLTHTFRLIVSGLFDEFPALKIIVGHLGETAPFLLWRTDNILGERAPMPRAFAPSTFGSRPAAHFRTRL